MSMFVRQAHGLQRGLKAVAAAWRAATGTQSKYSPEAAGQRQGLLLAAANTAMRTWGSPHQVDFKLASRTIRREQAAMYWEVLRAVNPALEVSLQQAAQLKAIISETEALSKVVCELGQAYGDETMVPVDLSSSSRAPRRQQQQKHKGPSAQPVRPGLRRRRSRKAPSVPDGEAAVRWADESADVVSEVVDPGVAKVPDDPWDQCPLPPLLKISSSISLSADPMGEKSVRGSKHPTEPQKPAAGRHQQWIDVDKLFCLPSVAADAPPMTADSDASASTVNKDEDENGLGSSWMFPRNSTPP